MRKLSAKDEVRRPLITDGLHTAATHPQRTESDQTPPDARCRSSEQLAIFDYLALGTLCLLSGHFVADHILQRLDKTCVICQQGAGHGNVSNPPSPGIFAFAAY